MNKKIESIDDMARFVESYPEFRAKSGNVSKHVALMSELSAVIERRRLMALAAGGTRDCLRHRSRRGVRAGGRRVAKSEHHGGGTIETRVVVCVAVRRGDDARRGFDGDFNAAGRQSSSGRTRAHNLDARRRKRAHRGFIREPFVSRTREQGGGKSQGCRKRLHATLAPLRRPPCKPPHEGRARSNPTTTPSSAPPRREPPRANPPNSSFSSSAACVTRKPRCANNSTRLAPASTVVKPADRRPLTRRCCSSTISFARKTPTGETDRLDEKTMSQRVP